jgi:hypothetical protein
MMKKSLLFFVLFLIGVSPGYATQKIEEDVDDHHVFTMQKDLDIRGSELKCVNLGKYTNSDVLFTTDTLDRLPNLRCLVLRGRVNGWTDQALRVLLTSNRDQFKRLTLMKSAACDANADILIKALQANTTLEELMLCGHGLSPKKLSLVIEVLKDHPTLKTLNIGWERWVLSEKIVDSLVEAFKDHKTLQKLRLTYYEYYTKQVCAGSY